MTSDLCYVLTPKNPKKVNLKYYYAYFNSRRKDIVRRLARGTNKKAINDTRLKSYRISFPMGSSYKHFCWLNSKNQKQADSLLKSA